MIPCLRTLLALAALLWATGCEINRVMTIKADGSGRIVQRFVTARDSYVGERPKPSASPDGFIAETLQTAGLQQPTAEVATKQGEKYGEGIKLVSYRRIATKETLGYEAVYSFPDVTKIRADLFVGDEGETSLPGAGTKDVDGKEATPRYFEFSKGSPSELRMTFEPKEKPKEEAATPSPTPEPTPEPTPDDPKQQKAMLEAMKHLDIRVAIRVEGKIVETNSHFRQGNEVVLHEMNLKGMMSDPKYKKTFTSAATAGKTSPDDLPPDDKYLKDESVETLSIRFQ